MADTTMDDNDGSEGNGHSPMDFSMIDPLPRDELEAFIRAKQGKQLSEYLFNDQNFSWMLSDKDFRDLQHLLRVAQAEHLNAHNEFEDLRYRLTHMTISVGKNEILPPLHADDDFRQYVARLQEQHEQQGQHIAKLKETFNEAARIDLLRESVKDMLDLIDSVEGKPETREELRASIVRTVKRRSKLLGCAEEAKRVLRK